jgi:hypothetical protein
MGQRQYNTRRGRVCLDTKTQGRTTASSNDLHPKVLNPRGDEAIIIMFGVQVLPHRLWTVRFLQ